MSHLDVDFLWFLYRQLRTSLLVGSPSLEVIGQHSGLPKQFRLTLIIVEWNRFFRKFNSPELGVSDHLGGVPLSHSVGKSSHLRKDYNSSSAMIVNGDDHPCLTHWNRDKMARILQTTYSKEFSWQKCLYFDSYLNQVCFKDPINSKSALVQLMALSLTGCQALAEPVLIKMSDACGPNRRKWW